MHLWAPSSVYIVSSKAGAALLIPNKPKREPRKTVGIYLNRSQQQIVARNDADLACHCRAVQLQSQTQSARPRSKLEEVMQKEKAMEKQKAQRAASAAAFSSKPSTGRKDEPWLVTGIIVKARSYIYLSQACWLPNTMSALLLADSTVSACVQLYVRAVFLQFIPALTPQQ